MFCCVGTLLIAFMGLLRSTKFEAFLMITANLIFLSTALFEYNRDFKYLKSPEKIKTEVVMSELNKMDSIRVVRFKDARVVTAEIIRMDDTYSAGSEDALAPIVDTWRDTLKGDSLFAFAVGYIFDNYSETLLAAWEDTCMTGVVTKGEEYEDRYKLLVEKWKEQFGRAVAKHPVFIEKSCYNYLNDGRNVSELIGLFIFLLIAWIIIVSIVRGIAALIRAGGNTRPINPP